MSQHVAPFFTVNLSCEVLFIIHARLQDQNIGIKRIELIMHDIVSSIFNDAFMESLFSPQDICGKSAVYKVFLLLNECPTISLNESSLRKLYDIVLMAVKYQFYTLSHPLELLEMTFNHLNEVKQFIHRSAEPHIELVEKLFESLCRNLCVGQLAEIRQRSLNLSLDRRFQISLFMENDIQLPGGCFRIPKSRFISPAVNTEAPGLIRSFTKHEHSLASQQHFYHPDAILPFPTHITVGQWNPLQRATRMTKNGLNMFSGHLRDLLSAPCVHGGELSASTAARAALPKTDADDARLRAYSNEVNTLATMLRGARGPSRAAGAHGQFQLSLFDDDSEEENAGEGETRGRGEPLPPAAPPRETTFPHVVESGRRPVERSIAPTAVRRENQQLLDIIGSLNDVKPHQKRDTAMDKGAANDFLDIMDDV
ncbi:unnamed protein product [Phytomonas sp. EM1]|nr:unnamed protein product [Phytomonas sp. EM1]|eukprot:CCW65697.1 unnamed protein product [Phytomonas sp. isolate EM1]